ncbi:MAG: polymer-forming cytoskeletal protein [Deltaproteobacteria bacterium]|nr:polymer-forming cytoskeletal protein [Deltaproteobacteria bacterium]
MFGKDKGRDALGAEVIGILGKGMTMEGKLTFGETVRIDGSFKGEIDATGTMVVGDSGYVEGNIKVGSAIVTGEIKGVLEASVRVELRPPARVFGDIKTPTLLIADGVVFEGSCVMTKKETMETVGTVNY